MRPLDLFLFLFGHRGAVERIAATRRAWMIGAILVLSAGIARNYDHLNLLRETEWFVGPFAASLVSTLFIFVWLARLLRLHEAGGIGKQLGTFLTLVWLTAPCAWVYGIPVESMTDLVTATKWNIAFLAVVSLWRVFIMVRAVSLLTAVSAWRVLPMVLAPAALEMMVGSYSKNLSLVGIMGGVRLPPHTELLQRATAFTATASFWVFVVAFLACWFVGVSASTPLNRPAQRLQRSCWGFALAALVLWAAVAVPYHRSIVNRDRLKALIRQDDYPAAVAFASSKSRASFSRIHPLPPGESLSGFPLELLDTLPADAPVWLRNEWTGQAVEWFSGYGVRNEQEWAKLHLHPDVWNGLRKHAQSLRGRTDLRWLDKKWLEKFDQEEERLKASPSGGEIPSTPGRIAPIAVPAHRPFPESP